MSTSYIPPHDQEPFNRKELYATLGVIALGISMVALLANSGLDDSTKLIFGLIFGLPMLFAVYLLFADSVIVFHDIPDSLYQEQKDGQAKKAPKAFLTGSIIVLVLLFIGLFISM